MKEKIDYFERAGIYVAAVSSTGTVIATSINLCTEKDDFLCLLGAGIAGLFTIFAIIIWARAFYKKRKKEKEDAACVDLDNTFGRTEVKISVSCSFTNTK